MSSWKRILLALTLLAAAVFSSIYLRQYCSSPKTHAHTIQEMDEKRKDVQELVAAATAASVTVSLLPGDAATPVAEKLADLSQYLLIILCAIYLEKYLVTVLGFVCFGFLIPASLALLAVSVFVDGRRMRSLALRLGAISLALFFVIPASVWITDRIEKTYNVSLKTSIEAEEVEKAQKAEKEAEEARAREAEKEAEKKAEEERSLWDRIKDLPDAITDTASEVVANAAEVTEEKIKEIENMLNRFLESIAVMLITSCVIPVLVLLFFFFIIRTLFGSGSPAVVVIGDEDGRGRGPKGHGGRGRREIQEA